MDIEITTGSEYTITYTFENNPDLSAATMSFSATTDLGVAAAFTKTDADFDDTNEATGVVAFDLDNTDTAAAGTYIGQITALFSATSKHITEYITIWIKEAA